MLQGHGNVDPDLRCDEDQILPGMPPKGRPIYDPASRSTVSGQPHESGYARNSYLYVLTFLKVGTLELRQHVFGMIIVSLN